MADTWNYADMPECNLPTNVKAIFFKATNRIVEATYIPVLYVANQAAYGTYYCIVCKHIVKTNPPTIGCKILYIYDDPDSDCQITRSDDLIG